MSDKMLMYILNDQGEPEPIQITDPRVGDRWKRIDAGEADPWRVARDTVDQWTVSTVFLSVDHRFGSGPPVLWETMVFGPEPWTDWQDRYTSRADAEAGHKQVVARIASGQPPDDSDGTYCGYV